MAQTLAQKILQAHTDEAVEQDGQIVQCRVSMVLANDITGPLAIGAALAASALALFFIGLGISLFTGSPPLRTGLRQLIIGALAASVTYGAGSGVSTWVG